MINVLWIAIGGFLGAIARYFIGNLPQKLGVQSLIPIGTLGVNLTGSFLLGWLLGSGKEGEFSLFFGIGFLGAFTTFSTLNVEAIRLLMEKKYTASTIYLFLSYILGVALALAGYCIGEF